MGERVDGPFIGQSGDGIGSSPSTVLQYHFQDPVPQRKSTSGLSFSDSSNGSRWDTTSLLGEALVSKETSTGTLDGDLEYRPYSQRPSAPPPPLLSSSPTLSPLQRHNSAPPQPQPQQQWAYNEPPLPIMLPQYRHSGAHAPGGMIAPDYRFRDKDTTGPTPIPKGNESVPILNTNSNSTAALLDNFVGRAMGHQSEFMESITCPCCQQGVDDPTLLATQIDPHHATTTLVRRSSATLVDTSRGLSLLSAAESDQEEEEDAQLRIDHDMRTGVLAEGVSYRISKVIVEGTLHKKGSGNDWMKSRGWKPRWTRLAIGRIEGYGEVPVPMLCVSWYPSSTAQSTVIVLDSTVVLAIDLPHKEHTQYRFEIQHASCSRRNISLPFTRTFTAESKPARDQWVLEISQALLFYEKEKARVKKSQAKLASVYGSQAVFRDFKSSSTSTTLDPFSTSTISRSFDEVWLGDRFTTTPAATNGNYRPVARPTSPNYNRQYQQQSSPSEASFLGAPPLSPTSNSSASAAAALLSSSRRYHPSATTSRTSPKRATRSTSA